MEREEEMNAKNESRVVSEGCGTRHVEETMHARREDSQMVRAPMMRVV